MKEWFYRWFILGWFYNSISICTRTVIWCSWVYPCFCLRGLIEVFHCWLCMKESIIKCKKDEWEFCQALEGGFNGCVCFRVFFACCATSFFAGYLGSRIYLFLGFIESSVLDLATPFLVFIFLARFRYISLIIKYKYIYKIANWYNIIIKLFNQKIFKSIHCIYS